MKPRTPTSWDENTFGALGRRREWWLFSLLLPIKAEGSQRPEGDIETHACARIRCYALRCPHATTL
ncbi:hypothetical protein M413DRAFT_440640 [Hebeloma cylindrosporum]|uniref:Uncharacterized protein n=1 Tax=Hebeloma cylindrosporum TaxID=76867 RepID=A0A0C2Z1Q6_HEBCY|nr:hypothetical protein M413DRAFT_440640 [Hebeloma cylindrosporum h7]